MCETKKPQFKGKKEEWDYKKSINGKMWFVGSFLAEEKMVISMNVQSWKTWC